MDTPVRLSVTQLADLAECLCDRWVIPLLQRASRVLRRPEPPAAHPDCTACADLASWARKLLRAYR